MADYTNNMEFKANLIPNDDESGSLGSDTNRWKNLYAATLNGTVIPDDPKFTDTLGNLNAKDDTPFAVWIGTTAEYTAIETKDSNTIYYITDGAAATSGSTGGTGGAVDSVNGKTGVVVLTADDVDALPDSAMWTGTMEEYNALETKSDDTYYYITDASSLNAGIDSGAYDIVLQDSSTGTKYSLMIQDGQLYLLEVDTSADIVEPTIKDNSTGTIYKLIVEDQILKLEEVS